MMLSPRLRNSADVVIIPPPDVFTGLNVFVFTYAAEGFD